MKSKMNKITWEQAQAMCNEHEDHVTSFMRGYNRAVEDVAPDTPAGELGRAVSAWKDLNDRMARVESAVDGLVSGRTRAVRHGCPISIVRVYHKRDEVLTGIIE